LIFEVTKTEITCLVISTTAYPEKLPYNVKGKAYAIYINVAAVGVRKPSTTYNHGRPQKFLERGERQHFAYPFSGCERCNANGPQNTFYPFYTTKKIPHESTRSVRIF